MDAPGDTRRGSMAENSDTRAAHVPSTRAFDAARDDVRAARRAVTGAHPQCARAPDEGSRLRARVALILQPKAQILEATPEGRAIHAQQFETTAHGDFEVRRDALLQLGPDLRDRRPPFAAPGRFPNVEQRGH